MEQYFKKTGKVTYKRTKITISSCFTNLPTLAFLENYYIQNYYDVKTS